MKFLRQRKVTEEAIIEVFGEGTQVKAAEERQGAKLAAQNEIGMERIEAL